MAGGDTGGGDQRARRRPRRSTTLRSMLPHVRIISSEENTVELTAHHLKEAERTSWPPPRTCRRPSDSPRSCRGQEAVQGREDPVLGPDVPEGTRDQSQAHPGHVGEAVQQAHLYEHEGWYVLVDNLRYVLQDYDTNDPLYFGQHYKIYGGYNTGGKYLV
nr:uncharacterized protein LOC113824233 [Penaeus vannamei]